ncbi:ABC transporter ATP-binding protein [Xanthobacter sp. DSM 24535]|uniref:ABC transporter ATP-binding protein n=1 Tax=Roseixanthobacter psychrophilus TaxID=3119917 RepID=UPI00372AA9A8
MENVLSIRGLTKRFGGLTAVNEVDLDFPFGCLNAVIGPNGAGKTTLFNLITGMIPPDRGQVIFDGNDIAGLRPHQIVARGLSRTLQIKSVFSGLSVADNVRVAVIAHEKIMSPIRPALGYHDVARRVDEVLEETGLAAQAHRMAGMLAYGDVALLEIALALANRPTLLLLDEPICGMSPAETERTVARIVTLSKTTQIILIEHDMEVVFAIADLITVMAAGGVLARGTPAEIAANRDVQDAYLGTPEEVE